MATTIVDIGKKLKLSHTTVSRVLNNRAGSFVSQKTKDLVLQTAKEMNYQPSIVAQQLAGKRSKLIGVLLDTHTIAGNQPMLVSMGEYATAHGFRFITAYTHNNFEQISEHAADFMGRGVEGVVLVSHAYPQFGKDVAELFMKFDNYVFIDRPLVDKPANYVEIDYVYAAELAAEHLFSVGRERVVLNVSDRSYHNNQGLIKGYAGVCEKVNSSYDPCIIDSGIEKFSSDQEWADFLADKLIEVQADGVLVGSDVAAMWLISALKQKGVDVPNDMGVVSLYSWPIGQAYSPALTSLDMCQEKIALEAIGMVIDNINMPKDKEKTIQQKIFKPELIVGCSCGANG